jgi:hypothetical protein
MHDLNPSFLHEKGRSLADIVTDMDDEVRAVDSAMQIVAVAEGSGIEATWMSFVENTLAHLRGEEIHPVHSHEIPQGRVRAPPVGGTVNLKLSMAESYHG